ncbi:hypothetical protein BU14_0766s0001 [Porphyra umbilicalis]|uniref:ATP-dependent RNA helicase n=1 Tax=Porphyra umbilicalis TaxID=2786 RepID=A0A1X6NPA8_PORUM|nr:hypothetical protein BU14_0766s0001 [Porphyra umbilicalis]|eukprot:OSX70405.1 hypothetical protein BU14_0766s0001 [Porphyra umbilicalis]
MTLIQAESIPVSLRGGDVLCKAKTGSGKTLAFLLPALHRALTDAPAGGGGGGGGRAVVPVLVVSPTRELAQQIAAEAAVLLSTTRAADGAGPAVQCVVGGTNVRADRAALRRRMPLVLVGTPGRLNDHLQSHETGLSAALRGLTSLVFDEADQLLDMGFRPAIEQLLAGLPPKGTRQTLLFSATMPKDVRSMVALALRPDYTTVDCVGEAEATNVHVTQAFAVVPIVHQLPALLAALRSARREHPDTFKVIVFFTTARMTQLAAALFTDLGLPVLEIHSRKSQGARAAVARTFAAGARMVLFTSDVSARGVDYDDVTHVIQVGCPSDAAQYVHRLGRTGRAGKAGAGLLLLADFEAPFLAALAALPVGRLPAGGLPPPADLQATAGEMAAAVAAMPDATAAAAYQAWLGFYAMGLKRFGWSKTQLVAHANAWYGDVCGRPRAPPLLARTVGKMGLKGTPGLVVEGGGGGGGRGGGGAGGAAAAAAAVGVGGAGGQGGGGGAALSTGRWGWSQPYAGRRGFGSHRRSGRRTEAPACPSWRRLAIWMAPLPRVPTLVCPERRLLGARPFGVTGSVHAEGASGRAACTCGRGRLRKCRSRALRSGSSRSLSAAWERNRCTLASGQRRSF